MIMGYRFVLLLRLLVSGLWNARAADGGGSAGRRRSGAVDQHTSGQIDLGTWCNL